MLHPELPQNIEAERATLGCVLQNPAALTLIASWLRPEHFYLESNAWIYDAMLACQKQQKSAYSPNVMIELRKACRLDATSVVDLEALSDSVPSWLAAEDYAHEVLRCALHRQLVAAGGKIAALGYTNGAAAENTIADAQALLNAVQARGVRRGLKALSTLAENERARVASDNPGGIPTGFRDLDEKTGGLHNADLMIIAGRPAMGKTSFVLNMAYEVASINSRDMLIFELEMSQEQLAQRSGSMYSGVELTRVRHLLMNAGETNEYLSTLDSLAQLPVFIDDTPAASLAYIRNETYRHMAAREKPAAIIIDYLQLMDGGKKAENRVQEVSEISRGLKQLAREIDCPVIALSQLSRAVEGRLSKIPMLSDLRESGGIEQDADIVMFLYREEYYTPDTDKKGVAELHIAKHRSGPIGVVPLRFDKLTTRFSDLTMRTRDD